MRNTEADRIEIEAELFGQALAARHMPHACGVAAIDAYAKVLYGHRPAHYRLAVEAAVTAFTDAHKAAGLDY